MASARDAESSSHSLVFRVMRLCRPALHTDLLLRTHADDVWLPEEAKEETFLASLSAASPAGPMDAAKSGGSSGSPLSSPPGSSLSPGPGKTGGASGGAAGEEYFRPRVELAQPLDALGLNGIMVLPQSFGSIHLGETFCSYISVGNHATHDVSSVVIKAELQTERQRVVLADNTNSPLERIQAGGRHDFIIEHDIKDLGAHTLVCSASYIDFGESKFLPQYFKFVASNPLSVKTKVRAVKEQMFLEACIENCGKSGLFLDRVHFEPVAPWKVTELKPDTPGTAGGGEEEREEEEEEDLEEELEVWGEDDAERREGTEGEGAGERAMSDTNILSLLSRKQRLRKLNSAYGSLFRRAQILVANGGTQHFLYCLNKSVPEGPKSPEHSQQQHEGGGTLGRLEIAWRSTLGEPGRLQTQQILGNPVPRKEVEMRLVSIPDKVFLEHPFLVDCQLINHTDRSIGPLKIVIARDDPSGGGGAVTRAIVVSGPWAMTVAPLQPSSTYDFQLCLVALLTGVQRLSGIGVVDARDSKPYDALPPTDLLVDC